MTERPRPLTTSEKSTASRAYDMIATAVDGETRLSRLLDQAFRECKADFRSADIGRWHVIEAFVRGHRGDLKLGEIHRNYDGYMHAAIVGAGFRSEKPDFDASAIYAIAETVDGQRREWRARA